MARVRMITRTVEFVNVTAMVVNLETKQVASTTVCIPSGNTMSEKKFNQAVIDAIPDGLQFVMIESKTVSTQLYGMTEEEFMQYAKLLPDR